MQTSSHKNFIYVILVHVYVVFLRAFKLIRYLNDESATVLVFRVECQFASKGLNMPHGQWQTESESFRQIINLGEEFEEIMAFGLRDTLSCIFYHEFDGTVRLKDLQLDVLLVGILGGIINQFASNKRRIFCTLSGFLPVIRPT